MLPPSLIWEYVLQNKKRSMFYLNDYIHDFSKGKCYFYINFSIKIAKYRVDFFKN